MLPATATRALSEKINEGAAPADMVSGEQLRGRVRDKDGSLKRYNVPNKPTEENKHNSDNNIKDGGRHGRIGQTEN